MALKLKFWYILILVHLLNTYTYIYVNTYFVHYNYCMHIHTYMYLQCGLPEAQAVLLVQNASHKWGLYQQPAFHNPRNITTDFCGPYLFLFRPQYILYIASLLSVGHEIYTVSVPFCHIGSSIGFRLGKNKACRTIRDLQCAKHVQLESTLAQPGNEVRADYVHLITIKTMAQI